MNLGMPSRDRNKGWKSVLVKEDLHARLNSIRDIDHFESFSEVITKLLDHWIMCPLRRIFEKHPPVSVAYHPIRELHRVPVPVAARSYGVPKFQRR